MRLYAVASESRSGSRSLAGVILEVDHYVFAGRRDFSEPFRVLVAGGGTGDATIMLAQQLADLGAAARIVHLDISLASLETARARAEMRSLDIVCRLPPVRP